MAASCFAVCSLNIFSSVSFAGEPAVTLRSVDLDLFRLLSLECDLRTRLGDLELLLRSGLLGERLGDRLLTRDDRPWGEGL